MKHGLCIFFHVLLTCSLIQVAQAAEPDQNTLATTPSPEQDSAALVQALEKALSDAKDRVSELETELSNAQNTIEQLENQNTKRVADSALTTDTTQPGKAVTQTVRGHAVYD